MRSTISRVWLLALVAAAMLGGCSKQLGVGYNETYCAEHGCDYSDAGICGDPMEIYKYRRQIDASDIAYRNIKGGE